MSPAKHADFGALVSLRLFSRGLALFAVDVAACLFVMLAVAMRRQKGLRSLESHLENSCPTFTFMSVVFMLFIVTTFPCSAIPDNNGV